MGPLLYLYPSPPTDNGKLHTTLQAETTLLSFFFIHVRQEANDESMLTMDTYMDGSFCRQAFSPDMNLSIPRATLR